ncbi:MAG: metallophosphoesterase [Candidatus Methanomethylicaceae archaeon]|jgi:DNA repair exonuclease SbcCD nuclease subunit
MKVLHTADIHLRTYADDRWATLKKILEVGKEEKIDVLAISGDLFDASVSAENLRPKIPSFQARPYSMEGLSA